MSLKKYHQKRDFVVSAEPKGSIKKQAFHHLFVIQEHAASHLHYDFRLELDGVLKSWAVPKGPSLDPTIKRLAVQVEDHPIEYGDFEGIIPRGQYGGGTVLLWDKGEWEPTSNPKVQFKKGHIQFILKGEKLHGKWQLIQLKNNPKNWLLIKGNDEYAKSEEDYDILVKKDLSVKSHETLAGVKVKSPHIWNSKHKSVKTKSTLISPKDLHYAKQARMPSKVKPELATLFDEVPTGNEWMHEIKLDGYRILAYIKERKVICRTRNHLDWSDKLPNIIEHLKTINVKNAILDGELVVINKDNISDMQLLQNSFKNTKTIQHYYVFDIIYCDGYNLTETPLLQRKQLLKSLIGANNEGIIRLSDHILGEGEKLYDKVCQFGLEGLVSKKINSGYTQARTKDWAKSKCKKTQEFIVCGYTAPKNSRQHFGSLVLGYYDNNKLEYCGHVGTGFTNESLKTVYDVLKKIKSNRVIFPDIRKSTLGEVQWVIPKTVVELEYNNMTKDHILRHPSFKGIRFDKSPKDLRKKS